MKAFVLALLVIVCSAFAQEPPQSWSPKVDFSLEGASFRETMHWVSGWAYALTEMGKASAKAGNKGLLCLPKQGYVESRVLLDILNTKFKGTRITSEQASEALWAGAVSYYRCDKRPR